MGLAQEKTVSSSVNEVRLLEHLNKFFSSSTVVLAEIMQNSRRAGASGVWFEFDEEKATLTVKDNGSGIEDFKALLTLAGSGWPDKVAFEENPFGMGFFSVCFACRIVTVKSKGCKIVFTSEDIIEKRPINIEPCEHFAGTHLTLEGLTVKAKILKKALLGYARGFAIPVCFQGEELPRPYAKAALTGVDTEVGFIHIPGIHDHESDWCAGNSYRAYCQGFFVAGDIYGGIIIHVNHHRYVPRMPDRDTLVDERQADQDFKNQIRMLWREFLQNKKETMPAIAFAEKYWHTAETTDCLDLMNDVPVIPRSELFLVDSTPVRSIEGDCMFTRMSSASALMRDVVGGKIVLYSNSVFANEDSVDYFARVMFAKAKNLCFVESLPEGHWAIPYLIDLSKPAVTVGGQCIAKQKFFGRIADAEVELVRGLSVSIGGDTVFLGEAVAVGSFCWTDNSGKILVPESNPDEGEVLHQISNYIDEDGNYREDRFEDDLTCLSDLIAIMVGELPEKTVHKCLAYAGAPQKSNLRSCTFEVCFDENGRISVKRCA